MATLVVLVGVPGSGKTTLARAVMAASPEQWQWINQDTLGDRRACEAALRDALARGRSCIVDRCNFDDKQRAVWLRLARDAAGGRALTAVAVQLLMPLELCIQRVSARRDHPTLNGAAAGADVCRRFFGDLVTVQRFEGFAEVLTAHDPRESDALVATLLAAVGSGSKRLKGHDAGPGVQQQQQQGQQRQQQQQGQQAWGGAAQGGRGDQPNMQQHQHQQGQQHGWGDAHPAYCDRWGQPRIQQQAWGSSVQGDRWDQQPQQQPQQQQQAGWGASVQGDRWDQPPQPPQQQQQLGWGQQPAWQGYGGGGQPGGAGGQQQQVQQQQQLTWQQQAWAQPQTQPQQQVQQQEHAQQRRAQQRGGDSQQVPGPGPAAGDGDGGARAGALPPQGRARDGSGHHAPPSGSGGWHGYAAEPGSAQFRGDPDTRTGAWPPQVHGRDDSGHHAPPSGSGGWHGDAADYPGGAPFRGDPGAGASGGRGGGRDGPRGGGGRGRRRGAGGRDTAALALFADAYSLVKYDEDVGARRHAVAAAAPVPPGDPAEISLDDDDDDGDGDNGAAGVRPDGGAQPSGGPGGEAGGSCGAPSPSAGAGSAVAPAGKAGDGIILLFDLNGTLTSHTSKRYSSGVNKVRPGVPLLTKLTAAGFRVGIYTSATVLTVVTVRSMLEGAAGVPEGGLFEPRLVLHRLHTAPAPQARFAADRGQMITIVSAYSPTEAASDEEAGDFYLRVAALADKANDKRDLLIVAAVRREFNLQLSDRFGLLEAVPPEGADAQAEYDAMAAAIREVATNHLAPRGSRRRRGWQFTLSQRTLRLMDARQRAHTAWLRSKSAAAKRERNRANRAADAAVQRDRERWIGQQVAEAQDMLRKKNLRQFARACDRLAGRSRSHQIPPAMRDVSGALHSGPDGVLKAMTESFDKLYGGETKLSDKTLNQLDNDVAAFELTRATEVDEAHGRPPDVAETEACVRALRSAAAPGGDQLDAMLLRCPPAIAWLQRVIIAVVRRF
ncbi:hypothetical protein FOA52_008031 [Chlamydomonas sp. UWO 241]|nr:hypothetical protein FOA52_008031 [Chlamydomonas sp. UWO 241]